MRALSHRPADLPASLPARAAIALIVLYQRLAPPSIRGACRFTPTCSQYAREAIERFGLWRGSARALWRIARCHPFARHGADPVG